MAALIARQASLSILMIPGPHRVPQIVRHRARVSYHVVNVPGNNVPGSDEMDDVMHDATIAEIEKWLRECARASREQDAEGGAPESTDTAHGQDRPFWPYLESDDFWRE